jgi:Ca2+/H+ antiporter, TMEM165/GDT1 family
LCSSALVRLCGSALVRLPMTSSVLLALSVFGACLVESVEALTIVLAAGGTRGWRAAFEGAAVALVLLAVLVAVIGVPLVRYVPIDTLRVVIGAVLLVLGLGWLRKSVLRASGHKALHDEDAVYASTVANLTDGKPGRGRRDAVGFAVAFKGVFLEGMEVVLIVLSLGASDHRLWLASTMAAAAAIVVVCIGALVARQLREVPENALKFCVGVMLTSFAVFWIGEGAGLRWPGSDATIPVLVATFLLFGLALARWLKPLVGSARPKSHLAARGEGPSSSAPARGVRSFARFWMEFFVGDSPEVLIGALAVVALALGLRHERALGMALVLIVTLGVLTASSYRGRRRSISIES